MAYAVMNIDQIIQNNNNKLKTEIVRLYRHNVQVHIIYQSKPQPNSQQQKKHTQIIRIELSFHLARKLVPYGL